MNLSERKKLAQLARRLKAAIARYKSIEKRAHVFEAKRTVLAEKANRLVNLLYGKKGQSAGAARQKSLTAQFVKANKEAERLQKQENKVYEALRPIEEKIATLKENMRKVQAKKNPTKKASKGKTVLKATGRALKGAARGILASGAQILGASAMALNPKRKKRKTAAKKTKRKNKTIIKAKRVVVLNPKRKPAKKATKRRRNLDHRDSTHQVQVSKHWRAGGLSQWQRAHHAGQHDLFSHGIKAKPKRNPKSKTPAPAGSSRWIVEQARKAKARGYSHDATVQMIISHLVTSGSDRASIDSFVRGYDDVAYGIKKKRNATRTIHPRKAAKSSRRVSSSSRKPRATGSKKRVVVARKRKTNPSPDAIRKEFAGRHTKDSKLYFPDGTPQGLAKLGKLVLIKTKSGIVQLSNARGEVWLCADTNKRLHLGSTINAPLFDGAKNFGEVKEIEYQESKPHLGYTKKIIWFHHMGEEGGRRPELISNSKGELKFRGGDYRITTRGIEN